MSQSFFGQSVTVRECPVCSGSGEMIENPCRGCGGNGIERKSVEIKVKIPDIAYFVLISASIFLLIRFDSYSSLLNNNNLVIFDPREEAKYITTENGYLSPDIGDQCWVNLKCTMNRDTITITNGKFFKTISN